ncbi:Nuclear factor 7, ovary [Bagarius yarrelli]|uniref:Nuclear factor 7, ovary n=1 Tax=Bagarius yarrelli TaxID=175774 RepID=A0A556V7Y8_BAGYA|nr:Nuclear factor 7, ovary [Bagarius yarrelli]
MTDPTCRTPSCTSPVNAPESLMHYLKCAICMDVLKDPVTTTCGHTFCMVCLNRHMINSNKLCPLCKSNLPELKVNLVLKEIIKELYKPRTPSPDEFTGQPGEVPCDVCSEGPKFKAVKSCLICLSSYCKRHLNGHRKLHFKGHKLVAPLNDTEKWACRVHGRPLELYSVSEGKLICSLCVQKGTHLVSLEEETDKKKAEIDGVVSEIKLRIQKRDENGKELDNSAGNCLDLINQEIKKMRQVFGDIKKAVQKAEDEALKPLEDRKRQVEQEGEDLKKGLQEMMTTLIKTMSDLQKVKDEEDPVFFIQNYPSTTIVDKDDDWTSVFLDTELSFGTIKNTEVAMMANIRNEFTKLSEIVDVTLDPDTANAQLRISDDMRQVQNSVETRDVSDRPERFDMFGSILGQNRLTDSRAFWVVEVGNKQGWDIGVASEEANRKGQLSLKPSQGYWAIVHYNGDSYAALEDTPILLSLSNAPCKVGVFVDYNEKLVSFYDMEAETHIYSFTNCAFGTVIRPYFSPHNNQEDPLIICPVNMNE